jgi:flagellar basal-body rod protein FlgB
MPSWLCNEKEPAMTVSIEAVTTAALSVALTAASRRHTVVAANIANANTQGYVPLRLTFDTHVAEARLFLEEKGLLDRAAVESLRGATGLPAEPAEGAEKVQLDTEMTEMARNAVHFQALTQGVARHLSILALAASDGRK